MQLISAGEEVVRVVQCPWPRDVLDVHWEFGMQRRRERPMTLPLVGSDGKRCPRFSTPHTRQRTIDPALSDDLRVTSSSICLQVGTGLRTSVFYYSRPYL
jgi:hypothetical protein